MLLLFVQNEENDSGECDDFEEMCSKDIMEEIETSSNKHYVWISNLSGLFTKQVTKNHIKKLICDRCLHYFYSEEKLNNHFELCQKQNETRVTLPDKWNNLVKFRNFKYKIEIPFIIYADIESLLVSTASENVCEGIKLPKGATQKHIPNSIGYYFHSRMDPSLSYSVANNKYMNDEYGPSKPSIYMLYLDVNNLYGYAMTQTLPISNFEWVEDDLSNTEKIKQQIMNTSDNADFGFLLEVDLEYPEELHDLHNHYPFCAEHMCVGDSKHSKLVLTLNDKKCYVLHYSMLKTALKHGLKLKKFIA